MKFRYITPLVVAAGAAAAIIAAPAAMAADTGDQSYSARAGCHRQRLRDTGNAQINDSAPVQFGPQHPYGRAAGVVTATAAATGDDRRVSSAAGHRDLAPQPLLRSAAARLSW